MANMEEEEEERIKDQGELVRKLKFLLCCGEAEKITEQEEEEEVAKLKGLKEELGQDNEKKEELTEESLNYCMGENKVTDCGVLTEYGHGIAFCNLACAKNYSRVRSEAELGLEECSSSSSSSPNPSSSLSLSLPFD